MLDDIHTNLRKWYAIQTYSGYEKAVERNLKQKVLSEGMTEKIFDVLQIVLDPGAGFFQAGACLKL